MLPTEQALHAFDTIVEKGKDFNLTLAGLKALASLRMEKGYRDYGHDMDNLDTSDAITSFLILCAIEFSNVDLVSPAILKKREGSKGRMLY